MGKTYTSIIEADITYIDSLGYAHNYYNDVVKEDAIKKKSLFGKFKDGVKKTFSKIYEEDYQFITDNGTHPLPPISSFTLDDARLIARRHYDEIKEAKEFIPINRKDFCNWDFKTGKLGTVSVLIEDKAISNADVMKILESYEIKKYL